MVENRFAYGVGVEEEDEGEGDGESIRAGNGYAGGGDGCWDVDVERDEVQAVEEEEEEEDQAEVLSRIKVRRGTSVEVDRGAGRRRGRRGTPWAAGFTSKLLPVLTKAAAAAFREVDATLGPMDAIFEGLSPMTDECNWVSDAQCGDPNAGCARLVDEWMDLQTLQKARLQKRPGGAMRKVCCSLGS